MSQVFQGKSEGKQISGPVLSQRQSQIFNANSQFGLRSGTSSTAQGGGKKIRNRKLRDRLRFVAGRGSKGGWNVGLNVSLNLSVY